MGVDKVWPPLWTPLMTLIMAPQWLSLMAPIMAPKMALSSKTTVVGMTDNSFRK